VQFIQTFLIFPCFSLETQNYVTIQGTLFLSSWKFNFIYRELIQVHVISHALDLPLSFLFAIIGKFAQGYQN
jgi:hypothetical protein